MTVTATLKRPSLFLSFAAGDREFAQEIAQELVRGGASVVTADEVKPGGDYTDELRQALRKSNAIVVALTEVTRRRDVPASVLFEIGAAVGADKPIFVVVDNLIGALPFNVPNLRVLPSSRVDEILGQL